MLPGIVGEGALTMWLLLFGVNAARWQARSVHMGSSALGP